VKTPATQEQRVIGRAQAQGLPVFSDGAARRTLYAICFGFFLVVLDTTALNVAIASIQREFGGTITGLQWVVNSYTMVFASLLLTCGALGDRVGARLFYQIGLALFTATSLLCALAPGAGFLIAMRIMQGLGAAIMVPASLSLLSHSFPHPDERTKAVTYWAAVVSLGFAAGPLLGGVLTASIGWRSIFCINVPVGIVALCMVRAYVKEAPIKNLRHIDWLGQAFVSSALFCLTYSLIEVGRFGWTAPPILIGFAASILLTGTFVLVEKSSSSPVLPASLFSNSTFSVCVAIGLVLNFGAYGTLFIESIYLQNIRHLNSFVTGLVILPLTVLPTVTTRLIVNHSRRRHIKGRLIIGQLIGASAAVMLALAFWDSGYWEILIGLALMGVSMGCVMPAITAGVLASSPTNTSGVAAGILNSARQVGGTLGVALMGSLFQRLDMEGLLFCFALMLVCFLVMAAVTLQTMQECT